MYKLTPDQETRFVANTQCAFDSWAKSAVRRKLELIKRVGKATTYFEIKSIKQLWYCNECDRALALGLRSNGVMCAKGICVKCLHIQDTVGVKNKDVLANRATILCDMPLDLGISVEDLPSPYLFDDFENLFSPITLKETESILNERFVEDCNRKTDVMVNRDVWSWRQKYNEYLKTDEWRRVRDAVMLRDKGMCQGCLARPASEVHHKTYEHHNNGREMAFELVSLCRECHKAIHGR